MTGIYVNMNAETVQLLLTERAPLNQFSPEYHVITIVLGYDEGTPEFVTLRLGRYGIAHRPSSHSAVYEKPSLHIPEGRRPALRKPVYRNPR